MIRPYSLGFIAEPLFSSVASCDGALSSASCNKGCPSTAIAAETFFWVKPGVKGRLHITLPGVAVCTDSLTGSCASEDSKL